jgi:Protein of unknown function DUF72
MRSGQPGGRGTSAFERGIAGIEGCGAMIRVGIGGWVFKPWRGTFYPKGLPQARELEHASRVVTTIEINGTFYGAQKPASFQRWAAETPDDFVFSLKGPRFSTHRRILAEAGSSIERFFASGVVELKSKLGPILWQMPPTRISRPSWPCCRNASTVVPSAMSSKPGIRASVFRNSSS